MSSLRLIESARDALAAAIGSADVPERYAEAHLSALRAAAAVLAARARPETVRRRPTSVWVLLTEVAPEFGEWAGFFAAGARKRAAAEAGLQHAVTAREADDLIRDAARFLELAAATVGVTAGMHAVFSVAG